MADIEITQHGDFQVATKKSRSRFVAWAKMGKILADDPVLEPGEHVWFDFGDTRESVLNSLLNELGLMVKTHPHPSPLPRGEGTFAEAQSYER